MEGSERGFSRSVTRAPRSARPRHRGGSRVPTGVKARVTLTRLRLAGLPFVGMLALLVSYPAPADAALTLKLRCPGAGGKTIVRTQQARVFTRVSPYFREPDNPDYYACLYRRKTAFRISLIDDYGVLVENRTIRLAGRYVALAQNIGCGGCHSSLGDRVVIRSLASGRALYVGPKGDVNGSVRDIVLKPSGTAAFIYRIPTAPPERVEVRIATASGDRVVEAGVDIDQTSLELSPDRRSVTYLKAGERRSTPIP